ncbi:hypothetical protein [Streptomyces asoensis]|uniref:hypothetical protein n=1 Tax=Streptomyces asoensis TaxID=249586 RepID=UPI00341074DB
MRSIQVTIAIRSVVATPLLLDIAQQGHSAARDTASGLLDEALSCYPHAGYTRAMALDGTAVPICCAIAHHLQARTDFLVELGKRGKSLLADAAAHWRFERVASSGLLMDNTEPRAGLIDRVVVFVALCIQDPRLCGAQWEIPAVAQPLRIEVRVVAACPFEQPQSRDDAQSFVTSHPHPYTQLPPGFTPCAEGFLEHSRFTVDKAD